MRYIDKDNLIRLIDAGLIATSEDIEKIKEEDAISVDFLLRSLTQALFDRKIQSSTIAVFYQFIYDWRQDNECK